MFLDEHELYPMLILGYVMFHLDRFGWSWGNLLSSKCSVCYVPMSYDSWKRNQTNF